MGEKSREGLVKSLKGEFVGLACSKHGSRTLDTIWKYSSIKSKQVRRKMTKMLTSNVTINQFLNVGYCR